MTMQYRQKEREKGHTYEQLMELFDRLEVLPNSKLLRLLITTDGRYILSNVNSRGQIEHPRLDLTPALSLEQMFKCISNILLYAKEGL